jgi:hypothetical protein
MSSPLMARPGARFECFSDGLCCTDIHALGPITPKEARAMRKRVKGSVIHQENVDALCMRPGPDGACAQREAGLCGVHKNFGAEAKPDGCRRFPYGLLHTPEGNRVTTEHRCPCRTLGDRRPLSLQDAARSLSDPKGQLEVDHWAPEKVPVSAGRMIPFAEYRWHEQAMIRRLLAGELAEDVLCAEVLPVLHKKTWPVLAAGFYDMDDHTAGGTALSWFGDALLHLNTGHVRPTRPRPWEPSFKNAIARCTRREDPEKVINDWVADELWMMRWNDWDCTFDVARAELATRLAVVRHLTAQIRARKVRGDQAAAEAVMISEVSACSEHWADVVSYMANDPSPAAPLH